MMGSPDFVGFVTFVVKNLACGGVQPSGGFGVSSASMRLFVISFLLVLGVVSARAAGSPLLNHAAEKWEAEGNRWAFNVLVREVDDGVVGEERVEHYDPSKPGADRWVLLSVDGQPPTEEKRAAWQKAKARKHRKGPKTLSEFFDLENATAVSATPEAVSYLVPLRSNHNWLFPVDRVSLTLTVNKATYAIEEVKAGLDEPFRVALGLARIIDVDFDVKINPSREHGAVVGPATSRPQGLAHVVISRLGKRIEYTWSDFKRVEPVVDVAGE